MKELNSRPIMLLPCPFCGGNPDGPNLSSGDHGYPDDYWIECQGCEITMYGDTEELVINKWNRRDIAQ